MLIPAVEALPETVRDILHRIVKPKFDAYFAFTLGGAKRSIPVPGTQMYIYPDDTMMSDLVFLWSLFSDVYQTVGGPATFADLIKKDQKLSSDVQRIVEGDSATDRDGSFWKFPGGRMSLEESTGPELKKVLQTLRNGFSHSHWLYANLSASEYWAQLGWDTKAADSRFDLAGRSKKNYMMYIADAKEWNAKNFWTLPDLRILVTPSHVLRFHLHLMLNYILNGSRDNVFQQ